MNGRAPGHVWLVGAGPGARGLITVAGLEALRQAEVVLYDRLASPELLDEAPAGALLIDAGKSAGNHAMSQDQINAALVQHADAGKRVVRLKGGDPFVFGRGGEEALALAEAGRSCTVIPGVTSAIAGLATAGIPITHRGVASSFVVVTGHEDPNKPETAIDWARHAQGGDTLVVLMGVGRMDRITHALIEGGRAASTPAAVVHAATTARQQVVTAPLADIARVATAAGLGAPSLLVVGAVVALQPQLSAVASSLAGRRVLIPRTRAQPSTLARLLESEGAHVIQLRPSDTERRIDEHSLTIAVEQLRAGAYAWVLFASAAAAEAAIQLLRGRGADARSFAGARLCALGRPCADALAGGGLLADFVGPATGGESVVEALSARQHLEGARLLIARAEGDAAALAGELRAAGAIVDELALEVALPLEAATPEAEEALALLRASAMDAVVLPSSGSVRNLIALLAADARARAGVEHAIVACIGPATSEAARAAGLHVATETGERSPAGLVAALRGVVASRPAARSGSR